MQTRFKATLWRKDKWVVELSYFSTLSIGVSRKPEWLVPTAVHLAPGFCKEGRCLVPAFPTWVFWVFCRLQGPLPHPRRRRLGGLDFERCGTCGHHTHPDSPEGGPPARTEGKREGIGREGEHWAMTSLILKPWVRREEKHSPRLPLEPGKTV